MNLSSLKFATVLTATAFLAPVAYAQGVSPAEAREITKEAYIYGYPMVDSYRVQYAFFADKGDPAYKAPWNQLENISRVYSPADTTIQTPNSDTPYSYVGMDLRAEPLVFTVPAMEKNRYFSVQMIDAFTFNFDYIGSRDTGNDGGVFVVAGPNWKGEAPKGATKVFHYQTEFRMAQYRTQLIDPDDIDNVKKIQASYKVETLSSFLGQPAPAAPPEIDFIKPLAKAEEKTWLAFFDVLNLDLNYAPTVPSEVGLMARFTRIGVGPGQKFDAASLSPEIKMAFEKGMADGIAEFEESKSKRWTLAK